MGKRVAVYGLLLAAGTFALQALDYLHIARAHVADVYVFLVGAAFLRKFDREYLDEMTGIADGAAAAGACFRSLWASMEMGFRVSRGAPSSSADT